MMEIMINVNEAVLAAVNRLADAVESLAAREVAVDIDKAIEPKLAKEQQTETKHIPYGRQIAEHFPMANVDVQQRMAEQAAQQAPVQPVPTAPVSQQAPVTQQPVQHTAPVQTQVTQPQVATTAQTYTLDDLSRAAMPLMDNGKQDMLLNLIAQFGVASLPELPPEQYGAFATALRGMGAQI